MQKMFQTESETFAGSKYESGIRLNENLAKILIV